MAHMFMDEQRPVVSQCWPGTRLLSHGSGVLLGGGGTKYGAQLEELRRGACSLPQTSWSADGRYSLPTGRSACCSLLRPLHLLQHASMLV